MTQSVPFDAYLGASKTGQAIGCIVYQLDGSTVYSAFSTSGWYESPASSGAILGWLFALARNKITQTATEQTLRNSNDTATIARSAQGADQTTYTREQWR